MVILLGLAAAVLYGSGDFLGGMATRRTHVLPVLMLADTAGVVVALAATAISPSAISLAGLAWGISAGLIGGLGLTGGQPRRRGAGTRLQGPRGPDRRPPGRAQLSHRDDELRRDALPGGLVFQDRYR